MEPPKSTNKAQVCTNPSCEKFEVQNGANIQSYGKDKKGQCRYLCYTCKKVTCETKGTVGYRMRHDNTVIEKALALNARGTSIVGIAEAFGVKPETVSKWIKRAGIHARAVGDILLAGHQSGPVQVDGVWTFVGNKGEKKWET
jgi:transposase-like protein